MKNFFSQNSYSTDISKTFYNACAQRDLMKMKEIVINNKNKIDPLYKDPETNLNYLHAVIGHSNDTAEKYIEAISYLHLQWKEFADQLWNDKTTYSIMGVRGYGINEQMTPLRIAEAYYLIFNYDYKYSLSTVTFFRSGKRQTRGGDSEEYIQMYRQLQQKRKNIYDYCQKLYDEISKKNFINIEKNLKKDIFNVTVPIHSTQKFIVSNENKNIVNDTWTIVRVWLPKDKNGNFVTAHDGDNVGHASLQTKDLYASFWPYWAGVKKGGTFGALFGKAKGRLIPELKIDIDAENAEPDVIVVLNTLDVIKIKSAFDEFSKSSTAENWSILGANIFNKFNGGGGQSCSGLVYDLLNAGGITDLISWDITSKWWTVAPDAIARAVVQASTTEAEISKSSLLPLPLNLSARVTKPNYDLNPHQNIIGYYLAQSSSQYK